MDPKMVIIALEIRQVIAHTMGQPSRVARCPPLGARKEPPPPAACPVVESAPAPEPEPKAVMAPPTVDTMPAADAASAKPASPVVVDATPTATGPTGETTPREQASQPALAEGNVAPAQIPQAPVAETCTASEAVEGTPSLATSASEPPKAEPSGAADPAPKEPGSAPPTTEGSKQSSEAIPSTTATVASEPITEAPFLSDGSEADAGTAAPQSASETALKANQAHIAKPSSPTNATNDVASGPHSSENHALHESMLAPRQVPEEPHMKATPVTAVATTDTTARPPALTPAVPIEVWRPFPLISLLSLPLYRHSRSSSRFVPWFAVPFDVRP